MRARELMTTPVVTAAPEMTVKEAAEIMTQRGVTGLPVTDRDGRLLGIVSESDILTRVEPRVSSGGVLGMLDRVAQATGADRKISGDTVADLMTTSVITADPEASLRRLTHLMNAYQINRIPIVDEGRLVGIVSRHDVIRALTRPDAAITEEVRWRLEHDLWIDLTGVDVSTTNGVVTLAGEVETRSDAELAARWAATTDGAVAVDAARLRYRVDDGRIKLNTDRLR
jgi:CBS domain-containing protein